MIMKLDVCSGSRVAARNSATLAACTLRDPPRRVVGRAAMAVAIFSLLPFIVIVLLGLPSCTTPGVWLSPPDGGWGEVKWATYLNVMFW